MIVVPDASVLLKWVLRDEGERHRDRALEVRDAWLDDRIALLVPGLWVYEVGNVLGLKQPQLAADLLAALIDLHLPEVAPARYVTRILTLMGDYGVTFYDSAYHALAIDRDGTMLTADRRYVARAAPAGHVALLDDWSFA